MSFLQPLILWAIPLIALPILIHLINQWRYQTRRWAPMMFLLQANRMNRGLAKVRQWLILAMRTLVVAGLLFAVSRPLVGGFWSMLSGGQVDTTIVLIDRSPSMNEIGIAGETKLQAVSRQLSSALNTVGSARWAAVDTSTAVPTEFASLERLLESKVASSSSAISQFPRSLLNVLDYIQVNQPGSVDVWLCSDLHSSDWSPDSSDWSQLRAGFGSLAQPIRFHILAYADRSNENLAIRVTEVYRQELEEQSASPHELILSVQVLDTSLAPSQVVRSVPVQIEVEGVRSQIQVEIRAGLGELRELRVPLPSQNSSGWGKVSLPADSNSSDNDYYFVFESSSSQRVVLVTEDPQAARPLQIAASVTASGERTTQLEVFNSNQITSSQIEGAALVIWQADLPDTVTASSLDLYVSKGGRVVFFPPSGLQRGNSDLARQFHGVRWTGWKQPGDKAVLVSNWRGDQDLLAATKSGAGLPVGQLEINGHGLLQSEHRLTPLATLDGGDFLLARLPTDSGGIYFCSTGTDVSQSSLAENGVVLFVVIQRALQDGQLALQRIRQRDAESSMLFSQVDGSSLAVGVESERTQDVSSKLKARQVPTPTTNWQQVAGETVISTEFEIHAGVYRNGQQLFAINRPESEDQAKVVDDPALAVLFQGLQMTRIDQQADGSSSIFREAWRLFLFLVIGALIVEAALCLPKIQRPLPTT